MNKPTTFFATCPKNIEPLLEEELISLGAKNTKKTVAGVKFSGTLALAYRACLWSRLANRILLPLAEFNSENADGLYKGVGNIKWLDHLRPSGSFVVDFTGTTPAIKNSHFGALKVKDAIVDQIRKKTGKRPDIAKENPDLRINVYLYSNIATVSIDLSGDSLHRRGYRGEAGAAPLKENLAAAILYRSKWLDFAKQGKPLLDPMCGSGTILIEAAMMAQDYAPGLLRKSFGFSKWIQHSPKIWQELIEEAQTRRKIGAQQLKAEIRGYDTSPKMVGIARRNVISAGLENTIDVTVKEANKFTPPTHHGNQYGIIVTNPPYGERLQGEEDLTQFYRDLGAVLRERFLNWDMAMLSGNPALGKELGIHSHKQYNFFNGTLACKLLMFHLTENNFYRRSLVRGE
jgi:23S rRNA (guanine2445-N2)-methyltransferase / 23S rRNA (guanine2069-N7)-methyltransferase